MWYRYRRGPRVMRFWWLLFIPLFFVWGHHWFFGLFFWIAAMIILSLIGRMIFGAIAGARRWGPTPNQYYQPRQQPYQMPYQQPYYQPSQQPYQSYQQRYQQPNQPQPETYQEGGQQHQYPQQQYDQYEQPQAEYPQEMPPMQQ